MLDPLNVMSEAMITASMNIQIISTRIRIAKMMGYFCFCYSYKFSFVHWASQNEVAS